MKRFLLLSFLVAPMVLMGAQERGPRPLPGPGPRPVPIPGPGHGGGHGPGHGPGHPVPGPVNGPALNLAQQLINNLNELTALTQRRAQMAYNNGNMRLYNDLRDISYMATRMGQEVQQGVVRPLRFGQPPFVVRQNLNDLRFDLRRLNQSVLALPIAPQIKREMDQVEASFQQLSAVLNGGFPGPHPIPGPGPIPVPGPQQYKCEAVDTGFEEHIFRPHVGYGPNVVIAQRLAIQNCQREHGSCSIRSCEVVR
ncbi:MAG: hypothetical protein R3B54_10670 [Bdellovibrionota bacterium]